MATIRKRNDSYQIRVSTGYNAKGKQVVRSTTWKPKEGMTERQIKKELNKQAQLFEEQCKQGEICSSEKFQVIGEMWLKDYAKTHLKKLHTVIIFNYQKLCLLNWAIVA
ncbi:MAG: hypothetical protein LIO69_01985 [Oscillospiraceae bacterium]|nr:hypothetical protein [Oscillospiraceae bacterium]